MSKSSQIYQNEERTADLNKQNEMIRSHEGTAFNAISFYYKNHIEFIFLESTSSRIICVAQMSTSEIQIFFKE